MTISTACAVAEDRRVTALELADWRRRVQELYGEVRRSADAEASWLLWRQRRDELFATHRQSPLAPAHRFASNGLQYWPYDARLRFELPLLEAGTDRQRRVDTGSDGTTTMSLIGYVAVPYPLRAQLGVWWLEQYGGGLFLPLRDATSGEESYGGGRYLLDTAKGADLGTKGQSLVLDFNFLYHPSCRYSSTWTCPLAPEENTVAVAVRAGERL